MRKYLAKVFYVLTGTRKSLVLILFAFILTSLIEAFGIGLIGPFFSIASRPELIQDVSILNQIYQQLGFESTPQFILGLGLGIIAIFCIQSVLYFLAQTYIYRYIFNQRTRLTSRLMKSYLSAPYTFYLKQNTATIIKNILSETMIFTQNSLQALLILMTNVIVTVVLLILLAYTSLPLLLMILGILLPVFLLFHRLGNKFQIWGKIQSESQREMVRVINHSLGGLKETRVIGCEGYFENQMDREARKYSRASTLFLASQLLPNILIKTSLLILVVLFISLSQFFFKDSGQDLTAIMSVFAVASVRLIPASSQLIQSIGQIRSSSHALDMLYLDLKEIENREFYKHQELLPKPKENGLIGSRLNGSQTMNFVNKIDLINVTYRYPDTSEPALNNISLSIKKGESIALIGKSGAGKTTLVDVILGLLEPESGDIQVDGVSVYNNIRSWQNLVGYIPQSIFLTDDTMERNIAFGVPDDQIDSERLYKAIKAAQLEELIEQLPEGVKTGVGERGVRLSGGQRQRIGIARALYHEREILVLDEATAALDNETESRVTEAIKSLAGTKTMIIIAHRLTTVEHCDRVYSLQKGQVVKSGSYQEVVLEA